MSEKSNDYESSVNVVVQRGLNKNDVYAGVKNNIGLGWYARHMTELLNDGNLT